MELKGLLSCQKKAKTHGGSPCLCLEIITGFVKKVSLEDFCQKELGCAHVFVGFQVFLGDIFS